MTPEKVEKVLDRLAVSDKATLVLERAPEGKIRVFRAQQLIAALRCCRGELSPDL